MYGVGDRSLSPHIVFGKYSKKYWMNRSLRI